MVPGSELLMTFQQSGQGRQLGEGLGWSDGKCQLKTGQGWALYQMVGFESHEQAHADTEDASSWCSPLTACVRWKSISLIRGSCREAASPIVQPLGPWLRNKPLDYNQIKNSTSAASAQSIHSLSQCTMDRKKTTAKAQKPLLWLLGWKFLNTDQSEKSRI